MVKKLPANAGDTEDGALIPGLGRSPGEGNSNPQERFNKDLEEIKKSQYVMNNAINEIKNNLERTNSR